MAPDYPGILRRKETETQGTLSTFNAKNSVGKPTWQAVFIPDIDAKGVGVQPLTDNPSNLPTETEALEEAKKQGFQPG